ncbi:MAG: prolipoprotein diacylglyceryl transferase [Clostridia bacterium]|nr:prolipoprotein diacylglyceryl transferase [Clostridia bacterium]
MGIICCCLRNKEYSIARTCDIVVIGLLLGQVIGRWGNYFNQELYGKLITDEKMQWFPFAVYIEYCSYCGHSGYHNALFFYEGVLNAIGFIICILMFSKRMDKRKPLSIALFYLFWYGIVRGSLEFLKEDHVTIGNSSIGAVQVICYVMSAVTLILLALYCNDKISFKWLDKMKRKEVQSLTDSYDVANGCDYLTDKD